MGNGREGGREGGRRGEMRRDEALGLGWYLLLFLF